MPEFVDKKCILEIDFQNRVVLDSSKRVYTPENDTLKVPGYVVKAEYMDRFLESFDSFWHTENDQLQALMFYDDDSLFCQRKKLKYDFVSGQKVYTTYTFTGYTSEQVSELLLKVRAFLDAETVVRQLSVNQHLKKVDENLLFFEKTLMKRMQERNLILSVTDWRILPDVVEKYPGEREMWMKYRQTIRDLTFKDPTEYPTPLDFFKSIKSFKWPIDPKNYWEQYPDGLDNNGNPVEYLSTDDQWVERDTESSRDLIESRLYHIATMRQNYLKEEKVVRDEVKKMMQELRLEDFVEAGIDYTKIYTQEEIDDMVQ